MFKTYFTGSTITDKHKLEGRSARCTFSHTVEIIAESFVIFGGWEESLRRRCQVIVLVFGFLKDAEEVLVR